ncbi:MAG: hypothetical protein IH786_05250, partial [Proteobacteria bacterium]|nr:hypothetical protein [Pseudomonadota bacterium]
SGFLLLSGGHSLIVGSGLLLVGGRLLLVEPLPREGERLLASLDWSGMPEALAKAALEAEAAAYDDPDDPRVNWDEAALGQWCEAAGLTAKSKGWSVAGASMIWKSPGKATLFVMMK